MNSRRLIGTIIQVIFLFTLATSCQATKAMVDEFACADFVSSKIYYGRPVEFRLAEVRGYPIDKQYAVFICGVQYMRPPAWEMAQPFASNGNAAAEFLVRKLPLIRDGTTIENIVSLLGDMNARGVYELKKNSELERGLRLAASRIKDQAQKERVRDALELLVV